ncbi:hypothetical protein NE865_16505 [Phthorimaea operculella]|nr:hypothetical protein NE865_16505 [Phthorimaea operculella]
MSFRAIYRRLKHKKLESDENCRPKKEGLDAELPPPRAAVEKPFLLSDGRVELEAWLDKATYSHGESISVSVIISNQSSKTVRRIKRHHLQPVLEDRQEDQGNVVKVTLLVKATYSHGESISVSVIISNQSSKTVRRIKALVVQHVDVCMFSNGKFKNVVALVRGDGTVLSGQTYSGTYVLTPHRGVTKNWIALEDSYSKSGASLASTVVCSSNSPEERNVFAIYVSYYVKVKLTLSAMGGEVSVKLPFILTHSCINEAPTDSVIEEATPKMILEGKENSEEEDEHETEKDKQNNNKDDNDKQRNEETAFEDAEVTSPDDHHCIADVLVNIENKIDRPKKFEGTEVRAVKPSEEELDLIVKYPGSDT